MVTMENNITGVKTHKESTAYIVSFVVWGIPLLLLFLTVYKNRPTNSFLLLIIFWCTEIYLTANVIQREWLWKFLTEELVSGGVHTDSSKRLLEKLRTRDFLSLHFTALSMGFIFFGEILSGWLFINFFGQEISPPVGPVLIVAYVFHAVCAVSVLIALLYFQNSRNSIISKNRHIFIRNSSSSDHDRRNDIQNFHGLPAGQSRKRISKSEILILAIVVCFLAYWISVKFK